MDYSALIHTICDAFVSNPDAILIRELKEENSKNVTLLICSENEDIAKMIGKKVALLMQLEKSLQLQVN